MPRTRCYRGGVLTEEDFSVDQVSEHLTDPSAVVWVDLCAPDLEGLQVVAEQLGKWDDEIDLTRFGVGALLHGLLDFVVDGHFEAVESLDDQIEQLEDLLFDDRSHD